MWQTTTKSETVVIMGDGAIRLDDVIFVSLIDDGSLRVIFRGGTEVFLKNGRVVLDAMRQAWKETTYPLPGSTS